jgi:hypothetical protein
VIFGLIHGDKYKALYIPLNLHPLEKVRVGVRVGLWEKNVKEHEIRSPGVNFARPSAWDICLIVIGVFNLRLVFRILLAVWSFMAKSSVFSSPIIGARLP